ncbi:MAG: hypothetical protein EPO42_13350 [Gallionellaceae bacterium]|nr:MAG: hypothetical protein EPO42_13350 [Gallionellaceae bacterium]
MKKAVLVAMVLALSVSAESAQARDRAASGTDAPAGKENDSNSLTAGKYGLSVSTASNTMVSGKYFIAGDMAVLGGFGFAQAGAAGGTSATSTYLMGGIRKYKISQDRADDFFPFTGVRAWYTSGASSTSLGIAGETGAEYFLAKHFSVEGLAAIGYGSTSPTGGTATSTFGTTVFSLGGNFYF